MIIGCNVLTYINNSRCWHIDYLKVHSNIFKLFKKFGWVYFVGGAGTSEFEEQTFSRWIKVDSHTCAIKFGIILWKVVPLQEKVSRHQIIAFQLNPEKERELEAKAEAWWCRSGVYVLRYGLEAKQLLLHNRVDLRNKPWKIIQHIVWDACFFISLSWKIWKASLLHNRSLGPLKAGQHNQSWWDWSVMTSWLRKAISCWC